MKLKAIKYFDVSNMREDTEPFLLEKTVKIQNYTNIQLQYRFQ